MRKILIVGCGGSGGTTLAYMMDQLKAELAPHGIRKLPGGWQFVHVDVPRVADTHGIPPVADQGGAYVGTAPAAGSNYAAVDTKVSGRVAGSGILPSLGTWLPREPENIWIPVSDGAGQLRAVGRALTLSEVGGVQAGLHAAWNRMSTSEAETEMHEVARRVGGRFGNFAPNAQPLVLVVSSMAGGAGASMALDVCRLLTTIPTLDPGLMGVFMFSPDVFDSLEPQARGGVRANGLAMLGEIVASQTRAAGPHDTGVLQALGITTDPARIPFARVFPVGRTMGVNSALFGDGSMAGVYRGLGRGLAALIASDTAMHQFTAYDLTNSTATPTDRSYFGWGESFQELQWGSFGYAALSLGRDRYRHYAAQRLARAAVDRLVRGHRSAHDTATDEVQLTNLVESQWSGILGRLDLPADASPQALFGWYTSRAFSPTAVRAAARAVVDGEIAPGIPDPAGMDAQQWLQGLGGGFAGKRQEIKRAVSDAAYRWAFDWAPRFTDAVTAEVSSAVATFGLPYARAVLDRVRVLVENQLLPGFRTLSEYAVADPAVVPPAVATPLASMRGVVMNPEEMKRLLWEGVTAQLSNAIHAGGAEAMSRILGSFVSDGLVPLRDALSESFVLALRATEEASRGVGLADVETDIYAAWPSGNDARVPDRFDVAHNEILLTAAAGFDAQYAGDVRASVPDSYGEGYEEAQAALVTQVISGLWPVGAGEEPPGGLLSKLAPWRAPYFNTDPLTRTGLTPSRAAYRYNLLTSDVLERATAFVNRRGQRFDTYCSVSLKEFAAGGEGEPLSVLQERHDLIVERFREALNAARPLIAVSEQAVVAVHGEGVAYRYKLSKVPFQSIPTLSARLREVVKSWPSIDQTAESSFDGAINDDDGVTQIDVFGSYKCYSPVVFSGLLEPVKEQWGALAPYAREPFWAHRRSRPLTAALPVGIDERRSMVAGWYVGRITGRIRVPGSPYSDPVRVWREDDGQWLDFPNPLLTTPDHFLGGAYDWLPAVLESMLLAVAQAHNPPILGSLAPYRALRGTFDDSPEQPVRAGGLTRVSAGQRALTEWLRAGAVPPGGTNVFAGADADERAKKVAAWIRTQAADVRERFTLPITRRVDAAETPFFRDLAADAEWALDRIAALIEPALRDAQATGTPHPFSMEGDVL